MVKFYHQKGFVWPVITNLTWLHRSYLLAKQLTLIMGLIMDGISVINYWPQKCFVNWLMIFFVNYLWGSLLPIYLLTFIIAISLWLFELSFSSNKMLIRWFFNLNIIKAKVEWISVFFFLENNTSWTRLRRSGLKMIF